MEKVDYHNNRKNVFNNSGTLEKKPVRYSQGKLLELGMYDVQIEIKSSENFIVSGKPITKDVLKTLIVLKSSIISVEVVKQ